MKDRNYYDEFVREALRIGFLDDQVDFLWNWIIEMKEDEDLAIFLQRTKK